MEKVECPWCNEQVYLSHDICPACNHEVLPAHLEDDGEQSEEAVNEADDEEWADETALSIKEQLENSFTCSKCGHDECRVREAAMTGTGISKLFDIQHNHFIFVSCLNCGVVDVYDPDILYRRKKGLAGSALDVFLG